MEIFFFLLSFFFQWINSDEKNPINFCIIYRGHRDRMVDEFTTTCAIGAYHH